MQKHHYFLFGFLLTPCYGTCIKLERTIYIYVYIYVFDIMYGCRSSRVDSWIGQFRAHGIPISHFSATISWYPTSSRIICWLFWIAQSHLLGNLRSMPWSTPWTGVPDLLFAFDFQISNAASGVRDWCWPVAVLMMVDRAQSCWCQKFQTFDFARYGTTMYKASWAQRSAAGCCLDLHRMWCLNTFLVSDSTIAPSVHQKNGYSTNLCLPLGRTVWTYLDKGASFTESPVSRPSSRVAQWWKIEQKGVTFCTLRSELKLFLEDIYCKTFNAFYLNPTLILWIHKIPSQHSQHLVCLQRQGVHQMDYSSGPVVTRQLGSENTNSGINGHRQTFPMEVVMANVQKVKESLRALGNLGSCIALQKLFSG